MASFSPDKQYDSYKYSADAGEKIGGLLNKYLNTILSALSNSHLTFIKGMCQHMSVGVATSVTARGENRSPSGKGSCCVCFMTSFEWKLPQR